MQTVGLLAAEIERRGIPTTSVSLLAEITRVTKPPRALFVPYDLGYPLGAPDDPEQQHQVIRAALDLLPRTDTPVLENFAPAPTPNPS